MGFACYDLLVKFPHDDFRRIIRRANWGNNAREKRQPDQWAQLHFRFSVRRHRPAKTQI